MTLNYLDSKSTQGLNFHKFREIKWPIIDDKSDSECFIENDVYLI